MINFLTFLAMESLSSLNPLLGFKITSICEGVKWDIAAHGYLAHFLSCMASVKQESMVRYLFPKKLQMYSVN